MEIEGKALVNKLIEAQYFTVFKKFDKDKKSSLDYS